MNLEELVKNNKGKRVVFFKYGNNLFSINLQVIIRVVNKLKSFYCIAYTDSFRVPEICTIKPDIEVELATEDDYRDWYERHYHIF